MTMFQILPLCFFLSLLFLNTQPLLAADEPEPPVLDRQGNPLQPGVQYYVFPVSNDTGGLALGHTRNKTCPLDIIRDPSFIGTPAVFHTSSESDLGYIPISTDLTVEMPIHKSPCKEAKVWRLLKVGSDFWFVSTQGVPGDFGSMFKIERFEAADHGANDNEIYSFKFCPSIPYRLCAPVGIFVDDDGTQVMAVGVGVGKPYHVQFQKASSTYPLKKNKDFSSA